MKVLANKTRAVQLGQKQGRIAYLFIAPVILGLLFFHIVPFVFAFVKSFYRYDGIFLNQFIGFENYSRLLLKDKKFWHSMVILLYYFAGVNVCMAFQIAVARMVQGLRTQWWQKIARVTFIAPLVVPSVVTIFMWKFIYYPEVGVISRIAESLGYTAPNLLGDKYWVNPAIIFVGFPWIAGMNFIIFYSAFQGMDTSMCEAAEIDGASGLRRFFRIELPSVFPQIKTMYMFALIGVVQSYEKILLLTAGGPNNASLVPGLYMYQTGFGTESSYGYSCAISVVLFIITMTATIAVNRVKED